MAKKKAKKAESSVPALTPAQQEKNWKEVVAELVKRRKDMAATVLEYYYDMGVIAAQLVREKVKALNERKYGNHVLSDLSDETESSETTLNYCMRFAQKFTKTQVQALQAKEWPWRQVQQLISLEDPKDREQFRKDWEAGKFEGGDALREAVSEHNEQLREENKRKDNRGKKAGFMEAAKTAANAITHAGGEILPAFIKAATEFSKHSEELEDKKRAAFKEHAGQLKKVIPVTRRQLDAAEKALEGIV